MVSEVDLFTFSHGGSRNKQGGCVPLMWLFYYQKTSLSPVHCSVTMLVTSIAIVYTLLPMETTEYRVPQTLSSILAVFRMLQPRALSLLNPIHCSSVD